MTRPRLTGPQQTPRLRLKPNVPATGRVDGAWWPYSDDLANELPDLLAVLSVRLGAVDRVRYNISEWGKAPKRLLTGGHAVRLDGYGRQPASTLEVLGKDRETIVLLVVRPQTDPDRAHATMMAASAPENDESVDGLLGISLHDREAHDRAAATEQRWTAGAPNVVVPQHFLS